MASVTAAASPDWVTRFDGVLRELARSGEPFTSEDVTRRVGLPASAGKPRNSAVGARIAGARKAGLIRRVGYVQAKRANQHATTISQWVGVNGKAVGDER